MKSNLPFWWRVHILLGITLLFCSLIFPHPEATGGVKTVLRILLGPLMSVGLPVYGMFSTFLFMYSMFFCKSAQLRTGIFMTSGLAMILTYNFLKG